MRALALLVVIGAAAPAQAERLGRADISSGILAVRMEVNACFAAGRMRTVKMEIRDGRVAQADVRDGQPGERACVRPALAKARFRRVSESIVVNYPFGLEAVISAPLTTRTMPGAPAADTLSRAQVLQGMWSVKGAVAACRPKSGRAVVTARIEIAAGKVASVRATGADPAVLSCVERAVSRGRFAVAPRTTVHYPFVLQR